MRIFNFFKKKNIISNKNPHSLDVYIDKNKNVIIVINYYYLTFSGMGIDIGDYKKLLYPYTCKELGAIVKETYKVAYLRKEPITFEERKNSIPSFKIINSNKGYLSWMKQHELILIRFKDLITIEYMHKEYTGNKRGYSHHLEENNEIQVKKSLNITETDLGEIIDRVYYIKNKEHLINDTYFLNN